MGKKSGPAPPPAPDPVATAQAQTQSNVATATANANLNRVDQYNPWGSSVWSVAGTNPDGTPSYRQDVTLTPDQQAQLDSQNALSLNLSNFANNQVGRVGDAMAQPFDISGLPASVSNVDTTGIPGMPTTPTPTNLTTNINNNTSASGVVQNAGTPQQLTGDFGRATGLTGDQGQVQNSIVPSTLALSGAIPGFDPNGGVGGYHVGGGGVGGVSGGSNSPTVGNVATTPMQNAIANAGNIQTGVQNTPLQTQMAQSGSIQNSVPTLQANGQIADVGSAQGSLNGTLPAQYSGNVQSSLDGNNLANLPGVGDFGAERQRVEDALYGRVASRLDPRFQQEQQTMENRLSSMGIARGSAAWNREVDNFNRNRNDAYSTAMQDMVLAGGNEQSRLFGLSMGARQQGFNENLASGQFANQADQQRFNYANTNRDQAFSENLASGQFANDAQAQNFAQAALRTQAGNDATSRNFDMSLAAGRFGNEAQAQEYGQNANRMAQENAAQGQLFDQYLRSGQFGNQSQQQQFSQNLASGQFANDANNMAFGQGVTNANLANSLQGQLADQSIRNAGLNLEGQIANADLGLRGQIANADIGLRSDATRFQNQLAAAQFGNNTQQQQFSQNLATGQFANDALAQQFGMNVTGAQLGNAAQQQNFAQQALVNQQNNDTQQQQYDQNFNSAQFANATQQQNFAQDALRAGFSNDAVNNQFGNEMAGTAQQAALRAQGFSEQQIQAQMQNQSRQQQMQEQAYLRNLPINEIAALMGTAGGVGQPQFSGVPGVTMGDTDIMGAVYNSNAIQQQQWQQQMQNRQGALGGIFGMLGTAGGMLAMSDRRMKENITRIGETVAGIPTYVFNYIGGKLRHFGVMAQEVLHVPGAVVVDNNGVLHVNYDKVWAYVR